MGEHLPCTQKIAGSFPVASKHLHSSVDIEHGVSTAGVAGSSPAGGKKNVNNYYGVNSMIDINRKTYDELVADQLKLRALEAGGVDNWEGYDIAIELLQKWKEARRQ